jgi:hypothetical protein
MGKSDEDVVQEFNELVNMSASELEKWLKVSGVPRRKNYCIYTFMT